MPQLEDQDADVFGMVVGSVARSCRCEHLLLGCIEGRDGDGWDVRLRHYDADLDEWTGSGPLTIGSIPNVGAALETRLVIEDLIDLAHINSDAAYRRALEFSLTPLSV